MVPLEGEIFLMSEQPLYPIESVTFRFESCDLRLRTCEVAAHVVTVGWAPRHFLAEFKGTPLSVQEG